MSGRDIVFPILAFAAVAIVLVLAADISVRARLGGTAHRLHDAAGLHDASASAERSRR